MDIDALRQAFFDNSNPHTLHPRWPTEENIMHASVKEALRLIWLEAWKRLCDNPSDPVRKEVEEIAHRAYRNC